MLLKKRSKELLSYTTDTLYNFVRRHCDIAIKSFHFIGSSQNLSCRKMTLLCKVRNFNSEKNSLDLSVHQLKYFTVMYI